MLQEQQSKLLTQFVFKMSVFHFNLCMKTRASHAWRPYQ